MAAADTMAMTTTQKIIAIAVTIIIISTVALPVVEELESMKYIEELNAGERFTTMEINETVTVTVTDSIPTINGVSIQEMFPDVASGSVILFSDVLIANFYSDSVGITSPTMFPDASGLRKTMGSGDSLVFSSGTVTYTPSDDPTSPVSTSYSFALIPSDKGDYGAFPKSGLATNSLYVDTDSPVYTFFRSNSNAIVTHGTLESQTVDLFVRSSVVDTTTASIQYEELSNGTNQITGVTYDPAFSSGVAFVVPLKYTVTSDSSMFELVGVIPIILILVPLMMAVRMITLRRN